MARIAIVHFPDHTAGATIDPQTTGEYLNLDLQQSGGRVIGIYAFPGRSELKCSGACVRKGSGAWGRDKMGFMKCSICGFRNKRLRKWFVGALFDWFGANLYPEAPALFRTPEGYGPTREND